MKKPNKKKMLKEVKEYLNPVVECKLCIRDILNMIENHYNVWEKFLLKKKNNKEEKFYSILASFINEDDKNRNKVKYDLGKNIEKHVNKLIELGDK